MLGVNLHSTKPLVSEAPMQTARWLTVALVPLAAAGLTMVACTDREPTAPTAPTRFAGPAMRRQAAAGHGPRHVVTLAAAEESSFDRAVQALGGQVERRHPEIGVVIVTGLSAGAAQALAARRDVASVSGDMALQWIPRPDFTF